MFAVIAIGGKQALVKEGDIIEVEKQDAQDGSVISIKDVLLIVDKDEVQVGQPTVGKAEVQAVVLKQVKAPKVVAYKYRRRKASHTKIGHRQQLTRLQVKKIVCG